MAYSKKSHVYKLIIPHRSLVFWEPCTEIGSHPQRFDRPVCDRERRREGGREGGRKGGREEGREGGGEGGREGENNHKLHAYTSTHSGSYSELCTDSPMALSHPELP